VDINCVRCKYFQFQKNAFGWSWKTLDTSILTKICHKQDKSIPDDTHVTFCELANASKRLNSIEICGEPHIIQYIIFRLYPSIWNNIYELKIEFLQDECMGSTLIPIILATLAGGMCKNLMKLTILSPHMDIAKCSKELTQLFTNNFNLLFVNITTMNAMNENGQKEYYAHSEKWEMK